LYRAPWNFSKCPAIASNVKGIAALRIGEVTVNEAVR